MTKLRNTKGVKRIKSAVEKYRVNIKLLRKKMLLAIKDYKEAMEMERVAVAKKRSK
jgi:hypothetical protein